MSAALQAESVVLKAKGPFDLALTLENGQAFRWQPGGDGYYGVVGRNIWKVRQAPRGLELSSGPDPVSVTAPLARRYFRLDDDLTALYSRLRTDPWVRLTLRKYRGLRLVRQDPWECLVSFIISAYSNVRRITRNIEGICSAAGDPVVMDGVTRSTFPAPAQLAELGEQDFRDIGLGYRAKFLARLARDLADRDLDLLSLRSLPYQEAKDALLEIYGVGEKVADCVLLFSLDKLEACPIDVHVRRAFTEWYFNGERRTDRALRLWAAEYFNTDAGYAQQYLFHYRRLGLPAQRKAGRAKP